MVTLQVIVPVWSHNWCSEDYHVALLQSMALCPRNNKQQLWTVSTCSSTLYSCWTECGLVHRTRLESSRSRRGFATTDTGPQLLIWKFPNWLYCLSWTLDFGECSKYYQTPELHVNETITLGFSAFPSSNPFFRPSLFSACWIDKQEVIHYRHHYSLPTEYNDQVVSSGSNKKILFNSDKGSTFFALCQVEEDWRSGKEWKIALHPFQCICTAMLGTTIL